MPLSLIPPLAPLSLTPHIHFYPSLLISLPLSPPLSHSLLPSLSSSGATVVFVNATDLDASREFGQASLIYSLQGSSQFRLNTRSGECVCMCVQGVTLCWILGW